MKTPRFFVLVSSSLFLVACTAPQERSVFLEKEVLPKHVVGVDFNERGANCASYVKDADLKSPPEILPYVRNLPHALVTCSYWRGAPMRYFGSTGKKIKLTRPDGHKQTVYSAIGYALADLTPEVEGLLTSTNVFNHLVLDRGDVNVSVSEFPTPIPRYGMVQTFYVRVSNWYTGERTVAALSVFDFPRSAPEYRAFLWLQDYRVTSASVTDTFGYVLRWLAPPRTMEAER